MAVTICRAARLGRARCLSLWGCALLILQCLTNAASAGYEEGAAAFERGDYKIALEELSPLAEAGDPYSEWLVAVMYRDRLGMGTPPDKATSDEWKATALKFMRRAAEHDVPYAMVDLAQMYMQKRWGPPDPDAARKLVTRAAELGTPDFALSLGMMYYEGENYFQIPQNHSDALLWVRRSADQQFALAEYVMGVMLEQGRAIPADVNGAIDWYTRAANQGVPSAQGSLGDLYYHGTKVERDCALAMKWLQAAADQDVGYAQYMLGRIFETGDCASKDLVQAYVWYSNAWFKGCGYIREHAMDARHRLEGQMTESQYRDAEETWRLWKPTIPPDLGERLYMYHAPHVEWPRSFCGWEELG